MRSREYEGLGGFNAYVFLVAIDYDEGGVSVVYGSSYDELC